MTEISKKFESLVRDSQKKLISSGYIMPVKTELGLLIGNVMITSRESLKNIVCDGELLFENINLNAVAIYIANVLALKKDSANLNTLYKLDQDYGKWFQDAQHLYYMYQKSLENKLYDKADIFYARYQDAKCRAKSTKDKALSLSVNAINKS